MDDLDITHYPNSKLREVIKALAPASSTGKKEAEEKVQDWTDALTYLTQVLSQSNEPREAQLILGEALKEKFSDPPLPINQSPTSPEVKVGVFMLTVGTATASKIIGRSSHVEAVSLIKSCLDLDEMSQERMTEILKELVSLHKEDTFKDMQPTTHDEHVAVVRMLASDNIERSHKAALSLLAT
jgi:hypothetical protein